MTSSAPVTSPAGRAPSGGPAASPPWRSSWPRLQPWLSTVARLVLAGVFLAAGWPKLLDSEGTVRSVRAFQLMPEVAVRPFAYGLPALELLIGVLLVVGLATRLVALVTGVLLVVFMVGIASAWARGLAIECGCFGGSGATVADPVPGYVADLLRDALFLGLASFLVRWPAGRLSVDRLLGTGTSPDPESPRNRLEIS